jgi:hypothetical protein
MSNLEDNFRNVNKWVFFIKEPKCNLPWETINFFIKSDINNRTNQN